MKDSASPTPGEQLLSQVRAGFVSQGTSFARWCRENGVARQNARLSLVGGWNGPKGQELRAKLISQSKDGKRDEFRRAAELLSVQESGEIVNRKDLKGKLIPEADRRSA